MSYEVNGVGFGTVVAGEDCRATQWRFMKAHTTAGQVIKVAANGGASIGVLQNNPNTGEAADIMMIGVSLVEAGAAVAAGALVMSDTVGRAITAATAGSKIQGQALEAASAAGQYIAVALNASNGIV